jgi:hypothetical protein
MPERLDARYPVTIVLLVLQPHALQSRAGFREAQARGTGVSEAVAGAHAVDVPVTDCDVAVAIAGVN